MKEEICMSIFFIRLRGCLHTRLRQSQLVLILVCPPLTGADHPASIPISLFIIYQGQVSNRTITLFINMNPKPYAYSCLFHPLFNVKRGLKCWNDDSRRVFNRSRGVFNRSRRVFNRSRGVFNRSRRVFDRSRGVIHRFVHRKHRFCKKHLLMNPKPFASSCLFHPLFNVKRGLKTGKGGIRAKSDGVFIVFVCVLWKLVCVLWKLVCVCLKLVCVWWKLVRVWPKLVCVWWKRVRVLWKYHRVLWKHHCFEKGFECPFSKRPSRINALSS